MEARSVRYYKKHTYSCVLGAAESSAVASIIPHQGIAGEVVKIIVTIPDFTNTVSTRVSMINEDTKEIFITQPLAQNENYDITLIQNECIIMGDTGEEWKTTLSGVPGGTGGTVTVTAYVE